MHAALLVAEMLAIIAALLAIMGAIIYGFCWGLLCLVRLFPIIGKRHRHAQWKSWRNSPAARCLPHVAGFKGIRATTRSRRKRLTVTYNGG